MPPKKDKDSSEDVLKLLQEIQSGVTDLNAKFDALDLIVKENQSRINVHDKKISSLESMLNEREQHSRLFSIRLFGLPLDADTLRDSFLTAKAVYQKVLTPILNQAVREGKLSKIPTDVHQIIEHCHVVPEKMKKDTVPILVRFQSRLILGLIFKYKKIVLTDVKKNLNHISICENLTAINYRNLQDLRKKNSTAFSRGGKLFIIDVNSKKPV